MTLHRTPLPYTPDTESRFAPFADVPWAVWLDSGGLGRYDLFSAFPTVTLKTRGEITEIRLQDGSIILSDEDPFALLKKWLKERFGHFRCHRSLFPALSRRSDLPDGLDLPFVGGAIGYFAYDLGRRIERLPEIAQDLEQIPEMAVGIYNWCYLADHERQEAYLIASGEAVSKISELKARLLAGSAPKVSFQLSSPPRPNLDWPAYHRAFNKIHHYLKSGDCYQVNLAIRFEAEAEGHPWPLYCELRRRNPAPFSAYLHLPEVTVLSSSPERFLQVRGGEVETKPIKGTRPRSPDPEVDLKLREELRLSEKDQAENLMIVDLLRNDLGKSCATGTVKVPKLFEVESFATVHHLVSTITGRLRPECHPLDLLRGCFPGGSITGAPKIRAMEIIEELEPHRRGVYCGSIGYISACGQMDTNIAIRTLVYSHRRLRFWAGGGIVYDSEVEQEYRECWTKAKALLETLAVFVRMDLTRDLMIL